MSKITPFCPICKKHGKSETEYTSHNAREENGRPVCPILLDTKCNRCGNVGHIAAKCPDKACVFCNQPGHTVFYCKNAPREQIDDFLKQRNMDYEDRKWRNNNAPVNNFRSDTFRSADTFRPADTFRSLTREANISSNVLPRMNNNRWKDNEQTNYRDTSEGYARNLPRREINTNTTPLSFIPKIFTNSICKFDILSNEYVKVEPAKDEFPTLGKKEDFPTLGKAAPKIVPKMNFAGIASIMVEPPAPKQVATPVANVVKPKQQMFKVEEENLSVDDYRERLYDKLHDEYYSSGKNNSEPWDMAYERIMKNVDRNVEIYARELEVENYKKRVASNSYAIDNYYDDNDDNNW
jgi:hypothetical protein